MVQVEQKKSDDCFSACLASILELSLDDVPNFAVDHEDWLGALTAWLAPMNLGAVFIEFNEGLQTPSGYAVLTAKSPRGNFDHAVVCHDGVIAWDPSPNRKQGVLEWKYWTLLTVLDPMKPVKITAADFVRDNVRIMHLPVYEGKGP